MNDWLILVYPKGGGQPKEVWWFKDNVEFLEKERELIGANEEFISFKAQVLRLFHRDEELGLIKTEAPPPVVYVNAWSELYKLYGERLDQENLDLMDSVLGAVEVDMQGEILRRYPHLATKEADDRELPKIE